MGRTIEEMGEGIEFLDRDEAGGLEECRNETSGSSEKQKLGCRGERSGLEEAI